MKVEAALSLFGRRRGSRYRLFVAARAFAVVETREYAQADRVEDA
jgi:hypothetical protein